MTNMIPRPEHPNPQWQRENWTNLNGEWMFEIDKSVSGLDRDLQNEPTLSGKITVPFCPESPLSGVGEKDFLNCVWYKKVLSFKKEELEEKRIILHFGAADYETTVYVNGESAGLAHVGGYSSFEYDITSLLKEGDNVITVRCYDDVRRPCQPGGKQCSKYYSQGCAYTRTTGIWQTVWYEAVPKAYVKYARVTPDAKNGSVSISAELIGSGDITATAYYNGKKVGEVTKKAASVTANLEIALSETHLWELGDGKLYDLVITFGEDKVNSYFGLRHVEMKDGKFYLNGKSVFQRLVLDQGYYHDGVITAPTDDMLIKDIQCSLDAGFNGARLHQKVFEPRFLYHADRMGYMVWGEYGSWGIDHSDMANLYNFLTDWMASVKRDYNHPSIIGWCPFNETWDYGRKMANGKRFGGRPQNDDMLRAIYEQTKLYDPTRPCIDTSGNFHVVTDIFDLHDYEQDPAIFKANYDKLVTDNELFDKLVPRHGPRQTWRGEPVFISEYGGIGFKLENADESKRSAWSYGKSTTSYEEFYARYKGLTDAILDNPKMFGFCYTQLTDVEQEVNGLFTFETREPKFDMSVISAINKRKAAIED